MSIPVDTYFVVTPASTVQNMPGKYATLGNTDLFFYITETGSFRVVNMNSVNTPPPGNASPGLISYSIAQDVRWMDVITIPNPTAVHVYYQDANGSIWYATYAVFGGTAIFTKVQGVVGAVTFSTLFAPQSTPPCYMLMIDDGIRHHLYVAGDPLFSGMISNVVTYNNALNNTIYLNRPSIAMHPIDTNAITVTVQETVIHTSALNVGFYEIKVPGIT